MKSYKLLTSAVILRSCLSANAQELVVRIDDMGVLHSVNKASIDSYQNGITQSVFPTGKYAPISQDRGCFFLLMDIPRIQF